MNIAIILASGQSTRFNNNTLKQFTTVNNKMLFLYSVEAFEQSNVDQIIIVTSEDSFNIVRDNCKHITKLVDIISGGLTRQQSVYNALLALQNKIAPDDLVVIHDAARPLIQSESINKIIDSAKANDASILVAKTIDTIARVHNTQIDSYLNRNELVNVQTPQAFKYDLILKAHQVALSNNITDASDDSQLLNLINKEVTYVVNNKPNLKITTIDDLQFLNFLLNGGSLNGK